MQRRGAPAGSGWIKTPPSRSSQLLGQGYRKSLGDWPADASQVDGIAPQSLASWSRQSRPAENRAVRHRLRTQEDCNATHVGPVVLLELLRRERGRFRGLREALSLERSPNLLGRLSAHVSVTAISPNELRACHEPVHGSLSIRGVVVAAPSASAIFATQRCVQNQLVEVGEVVGMHKRPFWCVRSCQRGHE